MPVPMLNVLLVPGANAKEVALCRLSSPCACGGLQLVSSLPQPRCGKTRM
jgi:hypothetical protein